MACFNVQIWKILLINYLHMKVGILAYTHCTSSMVTGVADVWAFANLQQANAKTVTGKTLLHHLKWISFPKMATR